MAFMWRFLPNWISGQPNCFSSSPAFCSSHSGRRYVLFSQSSHNYLWYFSTNWIIRVPSKWLAKSKGSRLHLCEPSHSYGQPFVTHFPSAVDLELVCHDREWTAFSPVWLATLVFAKAHSDHHHFSKHRIKNTHKLIILSNSLYFQEHKCP